MHFKDLHLLAGLVLCPLAFAASASDWRSRSIYQVLTDRFARTDASTTAECNTVDRAFCGGSWQGLTNQLDYIQGMGFDAVWISPVTEQIQGNTSEGYAYHGYWQQDINSLNSNFGTAQDLKDLASALHSRGMYLMVDVVVNHFGWNGAPSSVDYSDLVPFSNSSEYHTYCSIDYSDTSNTTQLEDCWSGDELVSLPDLRTEDSDVADTWNSWITNIISTYSVDGIRLDSAMQVNPSFWSGFLTAAGVYMVGEVYEGDPSFVCGYQDQLPGVMNYPTYFPLVQAFQNSSGNISALSDMISTVKGSCADVTLLGSFSENHDQPRFASLTPDLSLAQNVLAYTLLADGIPIVYEGQEQHYAATGGSSDPYNREAVWLSGYNTSAPLYRLAAALNGARRNAIANDPAYLTSNNGPVYADASTLAMRKGKMLAVLSNAGADAESYTLSVPAGYAAGTAVTELLSCATLTAGSDGSLAVPMACGLPRVYYPTADAGSQCGGAVARLRSRNVFGTGRLKAS